MSDEREAAVAMQSLWTAVLLEGLREAAGLLMPHAMSKLTPVGRVNAERAARDWIYTRDFTVVCDLAGMNADYLRKKFESGEIAANLKEKRELGVIRLSTVHHHEKRVT